MNNIFSFKRFIWIFRKTLMERPIQIAGIFTLNFIVVCLLYTFLRSIIGWNATQNMTFFWGMSFGGCYLSASMFNYFGSNASGSSYLTLPCSALEKWLVAIVTVGVLYTVTFIALYKLMDTAFVNYYQSHLDPKEVNYLFKKETVQPFDLKGYVAKTSYLMFGFLVSSMFVGSLYFNKLSFVKTALIVCVVFAVFFVLNMGVARLFFNDVADAFPFYRVSIGLPSPGVTQEAGILTRPVSDEASIEMPDPYLKIIQAITRYVLAGLLCVTAYIRLREKEF